MSDGGRDAPPPGPAHGLGPRTEPASVIPTRANTGQSQLETTFTRTLMKGCKGEAVTPSQDHP